MAGRVLLVLATLAVVAATTAPAEATRINNRTRLIGFGGPGDSKRPVVSDDGNSIMFDTNSPDLTRNPNRSVRAVLASGTNGGGRRLVSQAPDGSAGNGRSIRPAVSANGFIVAFESTASNLVRGDGNGAVRDIFVRPGSAPVALVTRGVGVVPANGDSSEVDLSADGTVAVFTSEATNLVARDANGVSDVFVCDLTSGVIARVSRTASAGGGNGPSSAPAISPDGRYVSFHSEADNLVPGDTEGLPDVFLKDLLTGRIRRVSVSSSERAQNRAVEPPFVQVSDVSDQGRLVVFDSDATNLVERDRRGHTDVFIRDVGRGETRRLSRSFGRIEANSDSVYPRITPDGRFVTFESFANNLFPFDSVGANSFLYDRKLHVPTLLDVRNSGRPSRRKRVQQLLQRPSVSADGNVVAFASPFQLVTFDTNANVDAYVRHTAPARARVRIRGRRYRIRVDDPRANLFVCRFGPLLGFCPRSRVIRRLPRGVRTLIVRPFGGGFRLGPPARARFRR